MVQIRMRFLLTLTVIAALAKGYKQTNCDTDNDASEVSSLNDSIADLNITESWIWLPDDQNSGENETVPHSKRLPLKGVAYPKDGKTKNWCMHVGAPFWRTNFSRFQLTNKCCKDHFLSQLLEINDNLRYRCKDETDFSNCLRKVNTAMSLFVGDYYFNRVSLKCYKIEEQEYCYGTLCGSLILKISNVTVPRF